MRVPREVPEPGEINALKTYLRLLRYAKRFWPVVVLVLTLSLTTAFVDVLPQQVIGVAINKLTASASHEAVTQPNAQSTQETIPEATQPKRSQIPIAPILDRLSDRAHQKWLPDQDSGIVMLYVFGAAFLGLFLVSSCISMVRVASSSCSRLFRRPQASLWFVWSSIS